MIYKNSIINKYEKKKIVFVVTEDWYFLSHRLNLALEAKKKGYEVFVITNCNKKKVEITNYGIKVKNWPLKRKSYNIFSEIKSILQLYLIINKINPDLIHAVAIKPIIYTSIIKFFKRKLVVINSFTGLGYIFTSNEIKTLILRKVLIVLLKTVFIGNKITIIVQNQDDYKYFIDNNIINEKKLKLVEGSGVDINFFKIKNKKVDNKIILLPARMLWSKGVKEFVECAKIVKKIKPEYRFVLCGEPDKENPDSIPEDYLKKLNQNDIVDWVGNIDNILSIYKRTLIVCLPSYREGLPKSLLEAASCQIPIVCFDAIGSKEIVLDGHNGFLVPFKDSQKLASAILMLINDINLVNHLGNNGRKLVESKFSSTIINKKIIHIWEESIS